MASKNFDIYHTRINRTTNIIEVQTDIFSHMSVIVSFEHNVITGYFQTSDQIIYGLYVDREFIKEFYGDQVKIQLEQMDTNHLVEIFAHPHGGFQFIRERLIPGNKIRIRFRARDPLIKDIAKHYIYYDNATGTYITKRMGEINAVTGEAIGALLKSGQLVGD